MLIAESKIQSWHYRRRGDTEDLLMTKATLQSKRRQSGSTVLRATAVSATVPEGRMQRKDTTCKVKATSQRRLT
jgi:hypothetical protein